MANQDLDGRRIFVVEDDSGMRTTCEKLLSRAGHQVHGFATADEAVELLERDRLPAIVLTDVRMPGTDGLELLETVRGRWPEVDVVVMTAFGSVDSAVEAMKRGAVDYVTKPFNRDELLLAIERVCRTRGLRDRIDTLQEGLEERYRFDRFLARSPTMRAVVRRMVAACRSDASILLTGESGTGKDAVARTIHYSGTRSEGPFVPVNCAGLPAELIESELFGHVRGAFTGAVDDGEGLFRRARGGTLMLDEVAEMPVSTQAKLLRVLQDKKIRPVGGTEEFEVDVRIVAATNRELEAALEEGSLRKDLYYRLGVLEIHLPQLRERAEDLIPLLRLFVDEQNRGRDPEGRIERIEPGVGKVLRSYSWPGNVRELQNLVERCFALGIRGTLKAADVARELEIDVELDTPAAPRAHAARRADGMTSRGEPDGTEAERLVPPPGYADRADEAELPTLAETERRAIARALRETDNNKAATARALGISRKTLYRKIERYGL